MANTTNYNWETPDDTDLVKDGAAAIRTLGSSIDTTTKALNPETTLGDIAYRSSTANTNTRLAIGSTGQVLTVAGGVPSWATPTTGDIEGVTAGTGISGGGTSGTVTITNSMATAIDAKGDLVVGTGADTFARLAVGTNGHTLVADSAETTGLKWAAPSSGALTLIDEVSFTASSTINVNDVFSSTYTNYRILLSGSSSTASNANWTMRLRASGSDTSANYQTIRIYGENGAAGSDTNVFGTDEIALFQVGSSSYKSGFGTYDITNPNVATQTGITGLGSGATSNTASTQLAIIHAQQTDSTQFTGFTILSTQTATGIVSVYGYKKE